ncbi:MAG: hypothetical protein OIF47_11395 [Marinibacterium sp.]|nr:hypothetical protein [Marinibacterium sp.]
MLRYFLELTGAFLVYGLSLWASGQLASHIDTGGHAQIWPALIPLPSTLLVGWVMWRSVLKMDEMQLRQQLEAIGIAFALTGLLTFNYGFLESVGFPRLTMFWVWPVMCANWVLGQIAVKLRY